MGVQDVRLESLSTAGSENNGLSRVVPELDQSVPMCLIKGANG